MKALMRWILLLGMSLLALQLYFVLRIALMTVVDPQSTTFERTQIWRIANEEHRLPWRQDWRGQDQLANSLKRAVIASEDSAFVQHHGIWWDSLEQAWQKNAKAQARADQQAQRRPNAAAKPVKIVGGSTITQQLAKNLFLSGERTLMRKGQEMLITLTLEALLSKRRILEIYLNHVEWGEGVFGAEAAAQHYFRKPAARLDNWEAARLAVMLPRPRYFEKLAQSSYLSERAFTITARMAEVRIP